MFLLCKKQEIPFVKQKESKATAIAKEDIKQFLPREIFHTFQDDKTENKMKIAEYCATILFVLFLEQHRHFGHQILSLAT